jgi:predicted glycoside hydrolase/deacetylase ChbG (UPF0249 family)
MNEKPGKRLILCADDYSLNPAINAAILGLLERGRLSAVSCMTQSPDWPIAAIPLKSWAGRADIGLHFNLTQAFPGVSAKPLPLLLLCSSLRLLPRSQIHLSFCRQLDAFEQALGRAPDFVDGHQHVHVLPQIRNMVIDECRKRYGAGGMPYMRSIGNMPVDGTGTKGFILRAVGGEKHMRLLVQEKIPHNSAFGGVYDFDPTGNLDSRMDRWLAAMPDGALIMCHPAAENASTYTDDPIRLARVRECHYLASDAFSATLARHDVVLSRYE